MIVLYCAISSIVVLVTVAQDDQTIISTLIKKSPDETIGPLYSAQNNISSGKLYIYAEDRSILIQNLNYDGSRGAVFLTGNESTQMEIPYKSAGTYLPNFQAEDVAITIPEDADYYELKWFCIFSKLQNTTLANITLHSYKESFLNLKPFASNKSSLRTGPILMLDDRTFFITNLHYNGTDHNATFRAGNLNYGNSFVLLTESNANATLKEYTGNDIYVRIPAKYQRSDFDYIGVMEANEMIAYSSITVDDHLGVNEHYKRDKYGNYVAFVPKCCPPNTAMSENGCSERLTKKTRQIKIHEANESFFNNESMNCVKEWYTYKPNCSNKMYNLDQLDEYFYLNTGVILYAKDYEGILTKDKFCIDIVQEDEEEHEVPFVCFDDDLQTSDWIRPIITFFICVSTFLLVLSIVILVFKKDTRGKRGFRIVGYVGCMAISYLCLASTRWDYDLNEDVGKQLCKFLDYMYHFMILASFMWLLILTRDTLYLIKNYSTNHCKTRFKAQLIVAFVVPILCSSLSIIFEEGNVENDWENFSKLGTLCNFSNHKIKLFFYIPICFIVLLCCILIFKTKRMLIFNTNRMLTLKAKGRISQMDIYWEFLEENLRSFHRSNYIILLLMTISKLHLLSYFIKFNEDVWIVFRFIDSLQGIFIFILYILYNPVLEPENEEIPLAQSNNDC